MTRTSCRKQLLADTAHYVARSLGDSDPGHDWWHVQRVRNYALYIGRKEGADLLVVELAALLHDIADYKFHGGDKSIGPRRAADWLIKNHASTNVVDEVAFIITNMNFKGSIQRERHLSLNHSVVQDADRLDALGAIGIARAFSFGGYFNRTFFDPNMPPSMQMHEDEYSRHHGTVINHFYEKLLVLRDNMLTDTGRLLAISRTAFLEQFLDRFIEEWTSNFDGDPVS